MTKSPDKGDLGGWVLRRSPSLTFWPNLAMNQPKGAACPPLNRGDYMAQSPKQRSAPPESYRHNTENRVNNPSVGLAPDGDIDETPQMTYYYNPHLQPILRSDPTNRPQFTPPANIC